MPYRINTIQKGNYTFYEVQVSGDGKKWSHFGPADTKEYAEYLLEKANKKEAARKALEKSAAK